MPEKTSYDIGWGSLWRILVFAVFVYVIYWSLDVLLAIFVALVLAAGLDTPVSWFEKRGVPRLLTTLLLFILGFIFAAGVIYTIVPLAISDFTQLFDNLKNYTNPLISSLQASEVLGSLSGKLDELANSLLSGTVPLTQVAASLFGNFFLAVAILILSFYLTVGQAGVERFLQAILPAAYEESAIGLYSRTRKKIGKWLKGQFILSLIVGFLVFIGLWILGVKYSLLLGILAGIFELIPLVGPIFGGAMAVLVALSSSFTLALYTLGLFVIVQQLENNLLVPVVMRYTTNLNSAVVLISILIGAQVFGFIGIILAVPVAVLLQEVVEEWTASKKKKRGLGI